ncbi:hypothetical protein BST63_20610 [Bradyrhizobium canariense]|uniref:Uncharacterized protein n=1 Tax=Bradyrhizobium canariense TaxID=255045 RepID=A0ABX3X074_9BRAD|nr:hypothetical protein BSR47_00500 [Bradyrhizobium canariense]OSJ26674.1 hypothetical protein BST63_20610 [Bradyrhizobium canariense]
MCWGGHLCEALAQSFTPNDLATSLLSSQSWKIFEIWSKKLSEAPAVCLRYAWHILRHAAFDVVNGALYLFASVATRH